MKSRAKIINRIVILTVCILSIFLGRVSLYYPNIKERHTDFSYTSAEEYLKVIANEPHSTMYHQEELKKVREYLVNELEEFNMNPQIFKYENVSNSKGETADLYNIYGKIDGKKGEGGSYILLVAHYDSAENNHNKKKEGYSFGAADDGYGVAVILETLRNIKNSGRELENGIKVLITDGEEMRLIGSQEEFNNNFSLYQNVSYVINLEARGSSGPAIMFQTSEKNSRVLELYKKVDFPITSSFISDLYKDSGRSDFLNAKSRGLQGVNFTTLDNVEYYHTPDDTYENISEKSIKHYGDQVIQIVKEFIFNDKYNDCDYFKKGHESICFVPLTNVILEYSVNFGRIISIVLLIAVTSVIMFNKEKIKGILIIIGKNIIYIICSMLCGFILSFSLAKAADVEFNLSGMGKVPGDDILVIVIPIIVLIVSLFVQLKKKNNQDMKEKSLLSGILLYSIILTILIVYLPGASYLIMVPLGFVLVSMGVIKLTKNRISKYILLLPVASILILYVQLILILNMAFSIGALIFTCAIVMISNTLISPIIGGVLIPKDCA